MTRQNAALPYQPWQLCIHAAFGALKFLQHSLHNFSIILYQISDSITLVTVFSSVTNFTNFSLDLSGRTKHSRCRAVTCMFLPYNSIPRTCLMNHSEVENQRKHQNPAVGYWHLYRWFQAQHWKYNCVAPSTAEEWLTYMEEWLSYTVQYVGKCDGRLRCKCKWTSYVGWTLRKHMLCFKDEEC